jgi:hypothetical protein
LKANVGVINEELKFAASPDSTVEEVVHKLLFKTLSVVKSSESCAKAASGKPIAIIRMIKSTGSCQARQKAFRVMGSSEKNASEDRVIFIFLSAPAQWDNPTRFPHRQ